MVEDIPQGLSFCSKACQIGARTKQTMRRQTDAQRRAREKYNQEVVRDLRWRDETIPLKEQRKQDEARRVIDRKSDEARRRQKKGDTFFVSPTSVAPTEVAGNGLYSLKRFAVGDLLPAIYPGRNLGTDEMGGKAEFEEFNKEMAKLTQLTSRQRRGVRLESVLTRLKNVWGITLHNRTDEDWPNLNVIYDNLIMYRFNNTYLTDYNWDGTIHEPDNPVLAPIFMNEPPPYDTFGNLLTGKYQVSQANVESYTDADGTIRFRVVAPIEPLDEMLFYYGASYKQKYEINLDRAPEDLRPRGQYTSRGERFESEDFKLVKR